MHDRYAPGTVAQVHVREMRSCWSLRIHYYCSEYRTAHAAHYMRRRYMSYTRPGQAWRLVSRLRSSTAQQNRTDRAVHYCHYQNDYHDTIDAAPHCDAYLPTVQYGRCAAWPPWYTLKGTPCVGTLRHEALKVTLHPFIVSCTEAPDIIIECPQADARRCELSQVVVSPVDISLSSSFPPSVMHSTRLSRDGGRG
ncbi:uncharacterized protein MYCFIDRAFT_171025 [Pseudocercospora fijiensis CIRAD86]|uniref:Uncharacterized protein n=1 Tax=Pseudocercospora fijiensis (strain CIRAD86) TaxID=383855 RepID=N1Q9M4_PSEFD|nr:uncharacterized protein MYCFIDRAFT_171025 [Pseudocercospora fijiensis CIRAD86]EME89595.1 hypothetical protein MYCFIDRAFT_171025 [Pseudocercospora fijiensis CIRAD86]